jgi:hypothetical protein
MRSSVSKDVELLVLHEVTALRGNSPKPRAELIKNVQQLVNEELAH